MKKEFYAHSREGKPPKDWHRLDDHLEKVAKMARAFADDFNAGLKFWFFETRKKGGE